MTQAHLTLANALDEESFTHFAQMLRRSFNVEDIGQNAGGISVSVHDETPPAELENTLRQILRTCRYASSDSIFHREVSGQVDQDPQPFLEAKGDVRSIGPGLFAFRGDFLRVRTALDGRIKSLATRLGADELAYPPLWPVPLLKDINYFHDFPHLVLVPSGVKPEYHARSVFAERFSKNSGPAVIACSAENGLAPAQNVLAPTVCDCCYWLLRDRRDVSDGLFTIHGQVFRNETSFDCRLDRLTAYTMREIVMVGSEDYVLNRRA